MEYQNKRGAHSLQVKKLLTLIALTVALTACGGGGSSSKKAETDSNTTSSSSVAESSSTKTSSSLVSSRSSATIIASSSSVSTTATKSSSSSLSSTAGSSKSSASSTPAIIDTDGDGVPDTADAFPLDKNETLDTDGDKIGNNADTDDDSDGVLDVTDAFPLDKNETLDTDGDKIGNNADTDDDGDGVLDVNDTAPLDAARGGIEVLSITASSTKPGYATVSWVISSYGTNTINLLFNVDGASGYSAVAGAQGLAATATGQVEVALPLLTTNFMNGRYLVELRNTSNELIHSKTLQLNSLNTADLVGYIKASNTGAGDQFGNFVALSADGNTLAVGAIWEDSNATGINGNQTDSSATDSGAVYVFTRTAGVWVQQVYIKASNTDMNDRFGGSVSLSADGNTLAVGAVWEDSNSSINGDQTDNSVGNSGAVYVFTRMADVWAQQAYLKASNRDVNNHFGSSVSLSADGNSLAVGVKWEVSNATGLSGAAYVFTRAAGVWVQQAHLKPSNAGGFFGTSVSLSADGNTLAVGADGEASSATGINGNQTDNSAYDSGAVYMFALTAGVWAQQAYVKASNTDISNYFGRSVSLSADGNTLAVGAYGEESNATGINGNQTDNAARYSGAVYVFIRKASVWVQEAYLKASNTDSGDYFGRSVSLSADGNVLAVGADGEDSKATGINGNKIDNSIGSSGAAYLFTRTAGAWTQQAYLKPSSNNMLVSGTLGSSVSLSADGKTLAVGASGEASNATGINGNQTNNLAYGSGAVYIY